MTRGIHAATALVVGNSTQNDYFLLPLRFHEGLQQVIVLTGEVTRRVSTLG